MGGPFLAKDSSELGPDLALGEGVVFDNGGTGERGLRLVGKMCEWVR